MRPSTNGANGRKPDGQFAKGNPGGDGNPFAKHVARLRAVLFEAVTPADLKDVVTALLNQAKAGDVASIKELLQRLLGPPVELDFVERLDALEQQIATLLKRGDSC